MGRCSVEVGDHRESLEHLPMTQRVGRPGVADPPFASLIARGADPRCESYRYGWGFWAPQVNVHDYPWWTMPNDG